MQDLINQIRKQAGNSLTVTLTQNSMDYAAALSHGREQKYKYQSKNP